jgi:beta-glucosidase-like glycosyl hydrolase
MPPFKSAVQRAKVASIMCSCAHLARGPPCDLLCSVNGLRILPGVADNAAYGEPTCASNEMNNQMVRSDWGWEGEYYMYIQL